jgi:hypothetical protein
VVRKYARAVAESLVAEVPAFEAQGRTKPTAVRLTQGEWGVRSEFLKPLLEGRETDVFGMTVEVVECIGGEHRFW